MRRSPAALLAIIGFVVAIGAAFVLTLTSLLPPQDQTDLSSAAAPSPSASQVADEEPEEEEDLPPEQRLPAGTALPLRIDQETRDLLSAAARAAVDPSGPAKRAVDVTDSGTIYYGEIYGTTPDADAYYVVAAIDRLYFWKLEGDGSWQYRGDYDARVCMPPVPSVLNKAWGAPFGGGPTPNPVPTCT
ncbi:hypothetical protein IMZ11_34750 [Microtetraspora sp. AC03309]|uniref:hypothetical protein n=1 Tax=Microtetraspora sp. AC03309 TaxID=2779376 RepID=UPI001E500319|nr:hypothetical protein [Microtetraspora sp. AC03309]MCC5580790.1 hypothetical protein [Microtetraspora sp. AC03309]